MLLRKKEKAQEGAKKNVHYLTGKETRAIAKSNARTIRALEKKKKRSHVDESEYLTTMRDENNIVEFDNLHTYFFTDAGVVKAVDGVSFDIPKGATVGVVGESGCGKSVTSLSIMQLVQGPQGQIVEGAIRFNAGDAAYDIAKMPINAMRKIRGEKIAMIFQEPMTSLNPVFKIGYQMDEMVLLHVPDCTKEQAKTRSLEMLQLVGIAAPERVYGCYPHELSGGMRQRVMIAIALACEPKLLIADEPTTALDVTIQAQILELMQELRKKLGMSIIMITHDLGVVASMCEKIAVMYAGHIVEYGTADEIFYNPSHEYTKGLIKSIPKLNAEKIERLVPIEGQPVDLLNPPAGCPFAPRCSECMKICLNKMPPKTELSDTHYSYCWLLQKEALKGEENCE